MKRLLVIALCAVPSLPVLAGQGHGKGAKSFESLDSDGNLGLSKEEVAGARRLSSKFDQVDTDKNGSISKEELQTFRATHKHHPKKPNPAS
ncbi:MAG TPA: hypothetical protein VE954_21330 [Oligoflexus sp.]|uniref:hypothetical protein n=1 Tax=Oligoflexus sp. TaxID=1971216 RepID=UPI002D6632A4|nr:hypothetical protein [Oligoflexus sp.]HYX35648.1 hypothetical protein [Oligoflexus sp.]